MKREVEEEGLRFCKRCWKEQIKVSEAFDRVRRYGLPFSFRRTLSERQIISRGLAMTRRYTPVMMRKQSLPRWAHQQVKLVIRDYV